MDWALSKNGQTLRSATDDRTPTSGVDVWANHHAAIAQAGNIRWVSLIKNGVTTHSFDSSQRLVDVAILSQAGGTMQVRVTDNPNLAPPGWYMLFLTDTNGVPSIAQWVHLT